MGFEFQICFTPCLDKQNYQTCDQLILDLYTRFRGTHPLMYPAFPENGSTSYLCAKAGTVFIKKVYTGGTVFMDQLYVPYNRLLVPRFKFLNF